MRTLEEALLELGEKRQKVRAGSLWRHLKTDTLYMVKDIVVVESDLTLSVFYKRLGDTSHLHWLRPLDEFLDGRFTREVLFKGEVKMEVTVEDKVNYWKNWIGLGSEWLTVDFEPIAIMVTDIVYCSKTDSLKV